MTDAATAKRPIDLSWHTLKEVAFFDCPIQWREAVLCIHPGARIETDAAAVLRAFVLDVKVGVFGKLRGFGSVLTPSFARDGARPHRPHRFRNMSPAERRARELDRYHAKKRAAWAVRTIEAGPLLDFGWPPLHHVTTLLGATPISSGSRATETPSAFTAPP